MKLSVVIPSRNGGGLLATHLQEVVRQARELPGGAEVLIVDDCSDDADDSSRAVVDRIGEPARLLGQQTHRGFSGTCNHGAREAAGELLFFLNNDMQIGPDCLETLVRLLDADPGLFAVSPVIINQAERFPESSNRIRFRHGVFDIVFPGRDGGQPPEPDQLRPLAYACGGALACRHREFLNLGGFPEIHAPFYWEDADLGWRARRTGLAIVETGAVTVDHDHCRTIGARYSPRQVRSIYERNRLLFTWTHLHGAGAWALHICWLLPRWVAALLRARSPGALPAALARLPAVRRERRRLAASGAAARDLVDRVRAAEPGGWPTR